MLERILVPPGPVDLGATLGPLRHGSGDPTISFDDGDVRRATRTPDGPSTIHIRRDDDRFVVQAWGDGAAWSIEHAEDLLGFRDDPAAFVPHHDVVLEAHRRHPGMRFARTGTILDSIVPSIIEQKVHGIEAFRSYRKLVRRFGQPAPGPGDLMLPPDPAALSKIAYHELHVMGIERRRADVVLRVCARANRMEEAAAMEPAAARARLMAIPGIGAWTAAEATRAALGDPDAVSVGDFHLPRLVAWALAGEDRADDARMLELLEPYKGQRARAIRLLEVAGVGPPRRAPRSRLRSIERI